MADERRREIRRRRILENSEARREKIFGVTKSTKVSDVTDASSSHPAGFTATSSFATSTPVPTVEFGLDVTQEATEPPAASSKPLYQYDCTSTASQFASRPVVSRESAFGNFSTRFPTNNVFLARDASKVPSSLSRSDSNSDDNLIGSRNGIHRTMLGRNPVVTDSGILNTEDVTFISSFEASNVDKLPNKLFDQAIFPCLLGLLVCFFICIGLEHVVFNSLVLPFLLFEGHRLMCNAWHAQAGQSSGSTGLIGAALLLCGFPPHLTARFTALAITLYSLGSHFAVYLVTVVLWQTVIGLPGGDVDSDVSSELMGSNSANKL